MDVYVPECQCSYPRLPLAARLHQLKQALAWPEDTAAVFLEIAKFLGTLGLIAVTGLLLLLAG